MSTAHPNFVDSHGPTYDVDPVDPRETVSLPAADVWAYCDNGAIRTSDGLKTLPKWAE